ncbi:Pre-mRNA-splicing factor slt11 [Coemansia sp. IMI 203386]|nr:Pre-mRNA-splicing factor slt11 [Coemansia sp. IMI 203386]
MAAADDTEFPILCETCLGENPYVRMTKESHGKECKICTRPFTIFRWLPGRGMRYKKTEICTTCAKLKNVCQTCILDLEHGLPVQVRDSALSIQDNVPKDDANRRDYLARAAGGLETADARPDFSGSAQPAGRDTLRRMARKEPYYKRNRAHICSFFVKGICTRGNECPYRHEMPQGDPELAKQNIVDRYHGNNDPVARRMLARSAESTKKNSLARPPDDKSITSLFVMGMDTTITQAMLTEFFAPYGDLKSIVVPSKGNCAFVNYKNRSAAETAAAAALDGCTVNNKALRVVWGRARPKGPQSELHRTNNGGSPATTTIPLPPGAPGDSTAYPSQDPTAMGAVRR